MEYLTEKFIDNLDESNNNLINNLQSNTTPENILNEIKFLETSLSLNSLPSFSNILNSINNESIVCNLIDKLKLIIDSKRINNEAKVALIERMHRIEYEKKELEVLNTRAKNYICTLEERLQKLETTSKEENKRLEAIIENLKEDRKQENLINKKLILKESQYKNEIKKRDQLINKMNDQVKKAHSTEKISSNSSFLPITSKISEINLSYNLTGSKTMNNLNNLTGNIKLLVEEHEKNMEKKYDFLLKDNIKLKNFIINFNSKFVELIKIKRDCFFRQFKDIYGEDFRNEDNYDLDINILNLEDFKNTSSKDDKNLDYTFNIFEDNYLKLKEFIIKTEELKSINNIDDKELGYITDKYVTNLKNIIDSYSQIGNISSSVIESILYKNQKQNIQQFNNSNIFENLKSNINHSLDLLNNLKEKNDKETDKITNEDKDELLKHNKFLNNLKQELDEYEKIIDNGVTYCTK